MYIYILYLYTYIFLLTCHNFFAWGRLFPKTLRVPRVSFAPLWGSDIQEPRDSWATWRRLYGGRKRNRLKSEIFSKSHIFAHLFFRVLGGGFRRAKLNRLGVRGNESPSHNYFSTAKWLAENVAGELINTSLYGVLVLRVGPSLCLQSQPS